MINRLAQLQVWYASCCDGDWEHQYGVKIDSLDNPGWWVKINLTGTKLEHIKFDQLSKRQSDTDWLDCQVKEKVFEGAGDAAKLEVILGIFLDWASEHEGIA